MTENKSFKESHPLDDFISDKELSNTTIQKEKLTIEQHKQHNKHLQKKRKNTINILQNQ